jgi:hypothetical protein
MDFHSTKYPILLQDRSKFTQATHHFEYIRQAKLEA